MVKPPIKYIKHKQQIGVSDVSDSDVFRSKTLSDTWSNPQTGSLLMLSDQYIRETIGACECLEFLMVSLPWTIGTIWNTLDQHCALEVTGCLPAELLRDVSWRPVHQG